MAIYHLHVDVGSRSKGSASTPKHLYIAREGKYARSSTSGSKHAYISREGKYAGRDELAYLESGNMPSWAQNPKDFWKAVDTYERKDGVLYREVEFALPLELSETQNIELSKKFTDHIAGNQHPYTLAIHRGKGHNPHAHLLFSERINDGLERTPERWFGKYNTKHPERGGAKKRVIGAEIKEWLKETRAAWANLANEALERANRVERIDHRSYKDQGVDKIPGIHIGPNVLAMDQKARAKAWRHPLLEIIRPRRMAKILEIDQYRARLEELKKEKEALLAEIEKRKKEAQEQAEQQRKATQAPPPRVRGLEEEEEEYLTVAPELETAVERIEGAYREEGAFGASLRIPIKALGLPRQKLKELGITKELTLGNLKNAWVTVVKEEAKRQKEALEEQKKAMREQNLKELEASDQARPEKPPWYVPFGRRRYEREWEEWHQQGKKLRKEINERNRVMDERIRRIEQHPELVKKDAAKQYPVLAMLGSEAIKALERKRKQEEAEKAKRQAEEAKEQADRLRKAAQAPPPRNRTESARDCDGSTQRIPWRGFTRNGKSPNGL